MYCGMSSARFLHLHDRNVHGKFSSGSIPPDSATPISVEIRAYSRLSFDRAHLKKFAHFTQEVNSYVSLPF